MTSHRDLKSILCSVDLEMKRTGAKSRRSGHSYSCFTRYWWKSASDGLLAPFCDELTGRITACVVEII